jgi:lipoprotein-anchoring transpeptidase ErfK/SrfK
MRSAAAPDPAPEATGPPGVHTLPGRGPLTRLAARGRIPAALLRRIDGATAAASIVVATAVALLAVSGMLVVGGAGTPGEPVAATDVVDDVAAPTTTVAVTTAPTTTAPPAPTAGPRPRFGHPPPAEEALPAPRAMRTVEHARVEAPPSSLVARAAGPEVGVTAEPGGPATMVLAGTTEFGSDLVLLLTGAEVGDWLEAWLPVRPNGSRGWVHRDAVDIERTSYAIGIDLEGRAFTLFDAGVPVLTVPVAVGRPSAPTPRGTFFVTDLLASPSPGGSYGPYAFGLSGYSDVFTEFQGGDGQVGFHGTNEHWSIGDRVSAGCVRLPNDAIVQLAGLLPLGVPTIIV